MSNLYLNYNIKFTTCQCIVQLSTAVEYVDINMTKKKKQVVVPTILPCRRLCGNEKQKKRNDFYDIFLFYTNNVRVLILLSSVHAAILAVYYTSRQKVVYANIISFGSYDDGLCGVSIAGYVKNTHKT